MHVISNQYCICNIACILVHFAESFYSMKVKNCTEKHLCMDLLTKEQAGLEKFTFFSPLYMGHGIPMVSGYSLQDLNGTFVIHFI